MSIDYLLHESAVGYAIFHVEHQADTIGNRLKEVQDAGQDLAKFGKMVKLVNFAPYRYEFNLHQSKSANIKPEVQLKLSKT
jgi:nucleolar protein 56